MYKVGETETIYELYVSGLPWPFAALEEYSQLNGGQLMRALKARLRYLNFNWIHYWSLSKGVTDDDRDLRKSIPTRFTCGRLGGGVGSYEAVPCMS